jgi:K(+)-stimulated pyrophosphate-energized sodium pump
MAIFQANAGGAWDNSKKQVKDGGHDEHGDDYEEMHKATVTGDTVGDPLKDTSGPSLNILIKLMSVISLVIAPLMG